MILSASRRTDIPAYRAAWFVSRLREGYVDVANPFDSRRSRRVPLDPGTVDCIVFWTRDADGFGEALDELDARGFRYLFNYTLTPYDPPIEPVSPGIDAKVERLSRLSRRVGRHAISWRYDPILLSSTIDARFHADSFGRLAEKIRCLARECVVSILDDYRSIRGRLMAAGIRAPDGDESIALGRSIAGIASGLGLPLRACCEGALQGIEGISPGACVDAAAIAAIVENEAGFPKDRYQRPGCGCAASVDIGEYGTCEARCVYCYANARRRRSGKEEA